MVALPEVVVVVVEFAAVVVEAVVVVAELAAVLLQLPFSQHSKLMLFDKRFLIFYVSILAGSFEKFLNDERDYFFDKIKF
ncbi:unnamed protein product [Rhizophagus irregularis]|nr:unnamed protein product [Rhizophagus irregularis]